MRGIVDRKQEIEELRALAQRAPSLGLLYGRRRVGKTFLLDHAWADMRHFYFLAADTTSEMNRAELIRELSEWSGNDYVEADFPSWRNVFRLLAQLAESGPLVVVLDEFQYLMGQTDDIVSQLVAIWDRELRGRPLTLVLCGSEVATMAGLEAGDSPLYGRPNWSARLRPFDYLDTRAMVPNRSPREAAYIYGVFGGTPRFLVTIAKEDELAERVIETVLSPRGEVHLQLERLIEQEKGIREPREYRAVLSAVADGNTETDRIAAAAGLSDRTHVVIRALGVLESLELIWRERNFDAAERTPWKNRIADHAVRFWYRFVHKNRSLLETGEARRVWRQRVEPYLDDYMGKVFERMCREAFLRHHDRWGLGGALEWARWEGQDRSRRPIEIDLISRLDDGRLLTGEIKWSSRPIDYDVHLALQRDLEDLARSGQGWAQGALDPERSAGHLYFSAAGFSDHFHQRAAEAGNILLRDLNDLYVA
jgi:AAA+ ATPase superfamily predicted ATPase